MSNDNRRTLGLKKAQKQTERSEDALMQKVAAGEGFADGPVTVDGRTFSSEAERLAHNAAAEAKLSAPPPPPADDDEPILIDEKLPYAVVRGEPGIEYVQGKDFYDKAKRMVREAPMAQWYFANPSSSKKSDMQRADEARTELKSKGLWHNVPGHDSPRKSIISDIEKENARAAAAEQHAA